MCQGNLFAPNVYNNTQVDSIASSNQATITSSTSFSANNIHASGAIAATSYYTDGSAILA